MIERKQYRGCLKPDIHGDTLALNLKAAGQTIRGMIQDGTLLTASLYRHQELCFLYYEALKPGICPEQFLEPLTPFLEPWRAARRRGHICIIYITTAFRRI